MPKKDVPGPGWNSRDLEAGQLPDWIGELVKHGIFKQIPASFRPGLNPRTESHLAQDQLYGIWYAFLAANKEEYPPRGEALTDKRRAALYADFGGLRSNFRMWWLHEGREAFMERGQPPLIKIIEKKSDDAAEGHPKAVTLEIPLTIPRELILEQLNYILNVFHPGDKLLRHMHSTAKRRIYPKPRYQLDKYVTALRVWETKKRWPAWEWWKIGEILQLSKALIVRPDDDPSAKAEKHRDLGTMTRRIYQQAERLMYHALRGDFPRDDDPQGVVASASKVPSDAPPISPEKC